MERRGLFSILDLSFNLLRSVPDCLDRLPSLRIIYFVQNRISHIDGLSSLGSSLTSLELGGNRIRVSNFISEVIDAASKCRLNVIPPSCPRLTQKIENLEALVNLEELWLGKNKIAKLEVRPHATF